MLIKVNKFGTTLVSRPSGKEAFLAFQPNLRALPDKERIKIDFEGVFVLTPSWADEFLTPLRERYKKRITLINTQNPSVQASLQTLEKANEGKG